MRRCLLLAIVVPCLFEACSRSADSPPVLLINEVMARNREFPFTDPGGHHLDWVEVYNPNPTALSLGGYTLTDNPKRPRKYRFPASETIPAGGHTVVWLVSGADEEAGEAEAVEFTSLHADFGISRREDRLLLYAQDGERVVDQVSFKNLATDTSMGRFPDGSVTFGTMFAPSPGEANHPIGVEPIRWESLPRAGRAPDGEPVPVRFTLLQDVEAGGASAPLPTVRVEFVEQDDCRKALEMLLDAAPSGFVQVSVELESEAEDLEPCTPDID
ncbi:MAG: lamin tail domain-containing protein, partial [Planctomycetota bacterium]|nr:lamin tail domain-containing protein [Planctomycetota bacterium]